MFTNATSFNRPIRFWNTSSVTDMTGMFSGATRFNQNLNGWDTSNVTTMNTMFTGATSFNNGSDCRMTTFWNGMWNQDNTLWWNFRSLQGTGSNFMFYGATCFNADISLWNIPVDRANSGGYAFRRNTALQEHRTPWNIRNFAPNGGR
jgi:surface protein